MTKFLLTPSADWYTVNPSLASKLEGLATTINHSNTVSASVHTEGLLKAKPEGVAVVEVSIVGADNIGVDASNPTHYDLRVVLDVTSETRYANSVADIVAQISNLVTVRNNTYISTRSVQGSEESNGTPIGFLEAVKEGLCKDGGLFMPRELPTFTAAELAYLCADPSVGKNAVEANKQRYQRTAQFVVEKLMGLPKDFAAEGEKRYGALAVPSPSTIAKCIANAYPVARWNQLDSSVSPLTPLLCGREDAQALEKKLTQIRQGNGAKASASPVREGKATPEGETDITKPGEESATPASPPSSPTAYNPTASTANANGFEQLVAEHSLIHVLEQYHGPTAAFKDFALQLFPGFFAVSTAEDSSRYLILAATSGDTGVAAINGFMKNGASDTKILVLFPETGVSPVQKAQMLSYSDGKRVQVIGLGADFDYCQSTVKKIFSDKAVSEKLLGTSNKPTVLSSANSINWGRLLPQIVYYVHAYVDLVVADKKIAKPLDAAFTTSTLPAAFDVVVPSGNFGNILSCYVAKKMGLPVRRFIVASNENDVLAEFINTGVYDITKRSLTTTSSPSIDILRASNVERFLYFIHDGNTDRVRELMKQLDTEKRFVLAPEVFETKVKGTFWASTCPEERCRRVVKELFDDSNGHRLFDPHTGVGAAVVEDYITMTKASGDVLVPIVLASTAHWGKFPEPVMESLNIKLLDEAACRKFDSDRTATSGACCGAGATKTKGDGSSNIEALAATIDKSNVVQHVKQMHFSIQRQCPNAQPVPSSLREAVDAPHKASPMVMETPSYDGIVEALMTFADAAL